MKSQLPNAQCLLLEAAISQAEITLAMQQMPKGRAPGPDDLLVEFYMIFHDLVIHLLLDIYNIAWDEGVLPDDFLLGDIVLLPKEGNPL